MRSRTKPLALALAATSLCALAAAAPSSAADGSEVVRAALLGTDAAVESGRFDGTMTERGFYKKSRVISNNSVEFAFDFRSTAKLAEDLHWKLSFSKTDLRFVAVGRKNYYKGKGGAYWFPLTAAQWTKQFGGAHAKNLSSLVSSTMNSMDDWRDEAPAFSDGVAIENYSALTDFPTLTAELLPNLTKIVYDAQFDLFQSDPKKWANATPTTGVLPRVTFGVDASNVLRRLHVEAPSALTAQGYELIGDFELTDVNESVGIRKIPGAHRVTEANAGKFLQTIFGITG